MARVVVIGGGIWGLSLAYRLQELLPSLRVTVLEARSQPGGKIDSVTREGFVLETGPNGFLDNNPATLELARTLGLDSRLVLASETAGRNRFLFLDGRLRRLPSSPGAFLGSDLLSWVAKVELLSERFRPPRHDFSDESIDAFARRRVGREIARTLADAMVTGILGGDAKLLSIQATFPRLAEWERDHGSVMAGMVAARRQRQPTTPSRTWRERLRALLGGGGARGSKMYSLRGGLRELIAALTAHLREAPALGVTVRRVMRAGTAWRIAGDGQDVWEADALVLACPAPQQATILADLDATLAERIAGIAYNRIAVVGLGYRRDEVGCPLDGFGYLSPQRTRRAVLGVQWCSSIYPGDRSPSGTVLLRALCGGWHRGDVVDWPDDRLVAAVQDELALTLRIHSRPIFTHLVRWSPAIPQYFIGHRDRVAWIEERAAGYPGLFLGGSAYRGVAVNDCIEQASRLAGRVADWLQRERPA